MSYDDASRLQTRIHEILLDALQLEADELPVDRPFLEVATSSLALVDAFRRVSDEIGVRPSLRRVFDRHGTIASLVPYLLELRARAAELGDVASPPRVHRDPEAGLVRVPLTRAQHHLRFISDLRPDASAAFNASVVVHLDGAIEVEALHGALQDLVDRHEGLRAAVDEGGEHLVVHGAARIELPVRDALRVAAERRREQIGAWLSEATTLPLDIRQALVRAELIVAGVTSHYLALTGHGLVADHASLVVLVEELAALYSARVGEVEAALPPAVSLVGWIEREVAREGTPAWRDAEAWWAAQLAGDPPLTDFPGDRQRPPIKSYRGGRVVAGLDAPVVQRAAADEPSFGVYLHMLGTLEILLSRVLGAQEVVVGAGAVALSEAGQRLVANTSNALVLRTTIEPDGSYQEHRRGARDRLLDALDHQDLPFAAVVAVTDPVRDQSRSPLFTVALDRRHFGPIPAFGPARASWVTAPCRHVPVDLQLTLLELPDRYQIQCDYSTDLFDASTIHRLLSNYRTLLEAALDHPSLATADLPWVTPEARAELLGLAAPLERDWELETTLPALVADAARRHPDRVALVDAGDRSLREWTYREVMERAGQVAAALVALGVSVGDRVGLCTDRTADAVVGMLGAQLAGAAYVPLDPAYPTDRLAFMAQDARLRAVLVDELGASSLSDVDVPTIRVAEPGNAGPAPERGVAPSDLAYVIYTSGSTGRPKGVGVEHRSGVNLVRWAHETFGLDAFSGMLLSTSFCFDLSVFEVFATLAAGGTGVLASNALALPQHPARDRVTFVNTVPSAMSELLQIGGLPSSVGTVVLAGEPLRRSLVQRIYNAHADSVSAVWNAYGPTECTVYATAARIPREDEREPTIGRPVANTRSYVLDGRGQLVPVGVAGELWLGGAGVARGYLDRDELTAASFQPCPFDGGRMYRTGDLVRMRPDGVLEYLGRNDHQVKIRGFRIELGEIESALLEHDAVQEAVVVARKNRDGEPRIVAYPVFDPTVVTVHRPDLRHYLGERLPKHMVPSHVVELPELPLLPNGKVDRARLPEPDSARESRVRTEFRAPSSDLEATLASIWSSLLQVETVGVDDDFFDLGGDSLLLTPMMLEISGRLGVRVTLGEFFEASTIAKLVQLIELLRERKAQQQAVRQRIVRTGGPVDALFDSLRADGRLADDLHLADGADLPTIPRSMFVTGVTGFVGAHTFKELLDRTPSHFTCMVRCSSPEHGHSRVVAKMKDYGLWEEAYRDRFVAVDGDLGRERLGMDPATWARTTSECDSVLHSAAMVNFIYPYHALRRINVGGVHEMLRFAFAGRPKQFHYVSTAALWPMGSHFSFGEDTSIEHGVRLNLGYDESKWVAEHLTQEAATRGLPVSVYRPGEVSGHSVSGICVLDHFMWAILKGSLQMCAAPDVKSGVDMAPVDYVAQAIAHLSHAPDTIGHVYHLNNPRPCRADELWRWSREYGYHFDLLQFEGWVDKLVHLPALSQNALYPFMAVLEEFEEENLQFPTYRTDRARSVLEPAGIVCPPVDAELLTTYYDWFRRVGFFADPAVYRAAHHPTV